jgi:hypothetical protein
MVTELTGRDLLAGRPPDSANAQLPSRADVTIWPLDLEIDDIKATRWFGRLTEDERARASRFVRREHQRRFVTCRYQLRQILGQLCGIPGSELCFRYRTHGKPEILGDPRLHFSVAHLTASALLRPAPLFLSASTWRYRLLMRSPPVECSPRKSLQSSETIQATKPSYSCNTGRARKLS